MVHPALPHAAADGRRKYQIFISSTYEDLIEERRAVTEVVLSMNHIPVGMELFEAGNDDQWSYIKNRILEVDYYLVIVAERYGSIGPDGFSYTEMEYRFAADNNVPIAALLLDQSRRALWPAGKSDFKHRDNVDAFRHFCKNRMVSYWTDTGSLTTKCQLALNGLFHHHPRTGWVSGNHAINPQFVSELARLSEENAKLRDRLAQYQTQDAIDHEISQATERLRQPIAVEIRRALTRYPWYEAYINDPACAQAMAETSLFDLIMAYPEDFLDGCKDDDFTLKFFTYMKNKAIANATPDNDDAPYRKFADNIVAVMNFLIRTWGLIETSAVTNKLNGTPEKWLRLSPLGRRAFDRALSQFLEPR